MSADRDTDRYRTLGRRTAMLGGLQLGMLGLLGARMYWLQVLESEKYQMLADDNRINMRLLAPSRGTIVDRYGVPLAINERNYRALIVSEQTPSVERTLNSLTAMLNLGDQEKQRILKEVAKKRAFMPVLVRENLTWEQLSAVQVNAPDLPGISIDVGEVRSYPLGESMSHVIGYVSAVSEAELKDEREPVLSLPGFKIGKNGVEKHHEMNLRGQAGTTQVEVNAYGRTIRELARDDAKPGHRLTMTIDSELQKVAYDRLRQEESGAAVVMDAHTGAIYVLASFPGYDPNVFSRGIPLDLWEELQSSPTLPLNNKASGGVYPPGSTFKMTTALAGLDSGAIDLNHTVHCNGQYPFGDHVFHCWKKGGHGSVGLTQALAQSCDCFFYDVGRRAGIDAIWQTSLKLGFGAKTGLDLPYERPGLIPSQAWKKKATGDIWHPGETLSVSIGQGAVVVTPLQLAVMSARIASGYAVEPHLAKEIQDVGRERTEWPRLPFKQQHLDAIRLGMTAVVQYGTAARSQIKEPGMQMAGKTGSAQVRRITAAERERGVKSEQLPWKDRDHGLFVAYAPVENPRYVCGVVCEHGNHGATAALVAHDLMLAVQKRDPGAIA